MYEPLISVIIPIFNAGKFLLRCLLSLKVQTYTNIEIICVDDGSTDGSGDILQNIIKDDTRFIVIKQKNKGEAAARNTGLCIAKGEYIGFCDADDFVEPEFIKTLYNLICNTGADVSVVMYSNYFEDNIIVSPPGETSRPSFSIGEDILQSIFDITRYRDCGTGVWNKLFKAKFFDRKTGFGIRFATGLTVSADTRVFILICLLCNKMAFSDDVLYNYVIHSNSVMNSLDPRNVKKKSEAIECYYYIIQHIKIKYPHSKVCDVITRNHVWYFAKMIKIAVSSGCCETAELLRNFIYMHLPVYRCMNADFPERIEQLMHLLEFSE